jgi:hypothetical protein
LTGIIAIDRYIELKKCGNLRTLDLFNTDVTDEAIDDLAAIPGVESVNVRCTQISAAGGERLRKLLPNATIEFGPSAFDQDAIATTDVTAVTPFEANTQ